MRVPGAHCMIMSCQDIMAVKFLPPIECSIVYIDLYYSWQWYELFRPQFLMVSHNDWGISHCVLLLRYSWIFHPGNSKKYNTNETLLHRHPGKVRTVANHSNVNRVMRAFLCSNLLRSVTFLKYLLRHKESKTKQGFELYRFFKTMRSTVVCCMSLASTCPFLKMYFKRDSDFITGIIYFKISCLHFYNLNVILRNLFK